MKTSPNGKNAQREDVSASDAQNPPPERRRIDVAWEKGGARPRKCSCDICREEREVRVYELSAGAERYFTDAPEKALFAAIAWEKPVRISTAVLPRTQFDALPAEQKL